MFILLFKLFGLFFSPTHLGRSFFLTASLTWPGWWKLGWWKAGWWKVTHLQFSLREKLLAMKRYSGFLKRPEILETVYRFLFISISSEILTHPNPNVCVDASAQNTLTKVIHIGVDRSQSAPWHSSYSTWLGVNQDLGHWTKHKMKKNINKIIFQKLYL